MNQESEPNTQPTAKHDLAQDLVDAINAAETPQAGLRLAALYNEKGAAAIAFTRLPNIGVDHPNLVDAFHDSFLATYNTTEDFIHDQLDSQGWLAATDAHLESTGTPTDFLVWDRDAILRRLRDIYDVVEYGGQIHVFAQ